MSRAAGTACCLLAATLLGCGAAWAQGALPPPADPVVAKVDGQPIHLSDVKDAVQALPENVRGMPGCEVPVIAAQMLGSAEGLGFLITRHRTLLNSPGVYAGIVLVLLITGMHEVLLRRLERKVAAYRQGA